MTYKVFGYLNIVLLLVILSPYCVRKLNEWFFHSKSSGFHKLMRILRTMHKPAAVLLLVSIFVHGWLAFGSFHWHTGTIAGLMFLLTALFGLIFFLSKKYPALKIHRALALAAVLLVAIHLLVPNLLWMMGIS